MSVSRPAGGEHRGHYRTVYAAAESGVNGGSEQARNLERLETVAGVKP